VPATGNIRDEAEVVDFRSVPEYKITLD